jgi:hypothetical protein
MAGSESHLFYREWRKVEGNRGVVGLGGGAWDWYFWRYGSLMKGMKIMFRL